MQQPCCSTTKSALLPAPKKFKQTKGKETLGGDDTVTIAKKFASGVIEAAACGGITLKVNHVEIKSLTIKQETPK